MKHSLLALGLISLPIIALAEDNTVVVTASRFEQPITNTLAAVTVLTEEDIQRFGDNRLTEVLSRVVGISQTPTGSFGSTDSLKIRGASTKQMIVLIDGVRVGSATLGGVTLSAIPVNNIERIEIVRGPVSSLYGADGIGGVIQIFTKSPTPEEEDLFVAAEYGSFNQQRFSTGFTAVAGNTSATGGFSYLTTDGFDSTTLDSNGNEDKDGFEQWSANIGIETELTENLQLGLAHSQSSGVVQYDNNGCSNNCDSQVENETTLMTSSIALDYQTANNWQLETQLGRHWDDQFEKEYGSENTTERLSYSILAAKTFNPSLSASFGTDGLFDSIDSSSDYDETERNNFGLFGHTRLSTGDFAVETSARVDESSAYGTKPSGNIALLANVVNDIDAIISAGTAFRAPTFADLYNTFAPSPDLDPEQSRTVELALREITDMGYWRISLYQTNYDDLIQLDPSQDYKAINVAEATVQGIEAEWSRTFNSVDMAVSASYINARDADDDELENIASWSGDASLARHFGAAQISTDVQLEGERKSGGKTFDGFVLLGLGTQYNFGSQGQSRLFGRIDNVLDADYTLNHTAGSFDYNTPGRTFKVGIEYHL